MPKCVYCSECGTKLQVSKKALKGYARIIDLISPHECLENPIEIDITPCDLPKELSGKFVQNLNNLKPSQVSRIDLRDRRKDADIKTSAPADLINQMKHMQGIHPEKDFEAI